MKLYGALFAASIIGASAFSPAPKPSTTTALNGFSFGGDRATNDGPRIGERNAPFASSDTANAVNSGLSSNRNAIGNRRGNNGPRDSKVWDSPSAMKVQGGSLRTWSIADPSVDSVQVYLKTDGRPLNADVELWQGPDNTPMKLAIYVEDGAIRPFSAVIDTPASQNAIAIRNTGYMEFPMDAALTSEAEDAIRQDRRLDAPSRTVQGGAVHTIPFEPAVQSVRMVLKTDGRPMNARIELLQGPNNRKQVMEVYCEDGMERPFVAIIETPGVGNVIRIVNTSTLEFPLTAAVEAYRVERGGDGFQNTFIVN